MKIGLFNKGIANPERHAENSFGSKPAPRTNHYKWSFFEWSKKSGDPLYMTRWKLDFFLFSLRLHRFSRSDDDRALHDHAWSFITIILSGGYFDLTDYGFEWCGPGSIKFRRKTHKHTIIIPDGYVSWSVVLTGPQVRRWGFYVKNKVGGIKFLNSQRYFRKYGHH